MRTLEGYREKGEKFNQIQALRKLIEEAESTEEIMEEK